MIDTTTATCPQSWGEAKLTRVALDIQDLFSRYGRVWPFEQWWADFCPQTALASAMRRWERLKKDFQSVGLVFALGDLREGGPDFCVRPIEVSSEAYAEAFVEALIGPADLDLDSEIGLGCKSVYDLFPEDSHGDVDWYLETLAKELTNNE